MISFFPNAASDAKAILAAMQKSQAVIQFDLDGKILHANENFCAAMGYELSEIVGRHHRIFVDPAEAESAGYREFWARLARGEFDSRQYKRFGKGGKEIWIEASYNPVFRNGKPYKVVKFATDITDVKRKAVEDAGKLEAISRSQAVIEFAPDGTILTANTNFCATVGYELSEIVGKHHRMFCDADYTASPAYGQFWESLARGEFISNEFRRVGKGGKEVWIQAAYNPVVDFNGKVYKVVKFATDVSERMTAISALGTGLKALADGDLTVGLESRFVPSMEQVRHDFNLAVCRLRQAMQEVAANAGTISSASGEIRSAADDLSKRTEQQAASVEQTAAAMTEVTATVSDSSKRAQEAGELVSKTRANAEHSGEVVGRAIEAMGAIETSSRQISNIIGMIDEIAFQTNLLALNAGVEAARAGEAGRGFAVVAQEVRELAQRSAGAAKEIKQLIGTSGEQVRNGVELVGETGEALEEMIGQVEEISVNVAAIVASAKEQAISLAEVNQAISTIDKGTQQNAAMVEESTAASHTLAKQAASLFSLIGKFRTGEAKVAQPPSREGARPAMAPQRLSVGNAALALAEAAASDAEDWEDF
ncbi:PAS domain-containing methyl-accepting chemotaxis protein [Aquamicrobium sp. LC103]|uniref:methyl-accepting chemotaxis protein n=1 Tax=Aquamicrobium sp. LC103 TaxID=1120658 RepID=UPI00063E7238|nr:PAS domain-containing methyl-accepting chemotaxis protein [Aquamicrobium sp. LC103]TKT77424.1 PAS domain S-box protein [Aquamicrobium sp. LC103]